MAELKDFIRAAALKPAERNGLIKMINSSVGQDALDYLAGSIALINIASLERLLNPDKPEEAVAMIKANIYTILATLYFHGSIVLKGAHHGSENSKV